MLANLVEVDNIEFANAAIQRLAELIEAQPALFQASRRGSERGAESLSARPFQGILEAIQNGDDLGASELRLAIRRRGRRRELLIVHDGMPVSLRHVGAMVLPWVTTKDDDPLASGRFGIGQKTLGALGGPIAAHCHPYHFRMAEVPSVCDAEPTIAGLYDSSRRETLLVVPLERWVDTEALASFVADLGTHALVFLRSIRRLSLIDIESGKRAVDHRLREGVRREVPLRVAGRQVVAEVVELEEPRGGQRYRRYLAEFPLKAEERRHNKATGPTTTLGVCVPARPAPGGIYDRLPLPVPCALPVGLNAQFDPDTARSTLHENPWNRRRFAEIGDLLAAVCLDLLSQEPTQGWAATPLARDCPEGLSDWLTARYRDDVIGACQRRLADELRLQPREQAHPLDRIVLEESLLDGLLTVEDQEWLAPEHEAIPPRLRDGDGRWREVLIELGRSRVLEVEGALGVLDRDDEHLAGRDARWYIKLAGAAIDAELFNVFWWKQGILLADGSRAEPPGGNEPRSLVCSEQPGSLATRLGLLLVIHPDYLGADADAERVRAALEAHGLLVGSYDSDGHALALLARGDASEPIRLNDDALLLLRDAFERAGEDKQRSLGPAIGRNIEVRGFEFDDGGNPEDAWFSPSVAYLPTQIDRERDSFARAAGKTPGLPWLSPEYARLLKRDGGRRELGAQKLLVRLGAQTIPRLIPPPNETQRYVRDPRNASQIELSQITDLQATDIRALGQRVTHLLEDRWSPDLDAVIENITTQRAGAARRRRAAALLGVLARGWERHYADHTTARAAWGYDGYWHVRGDVIATWLARAASEPWLPSATGSLQAPKDLHLPSEANRLTVGDKRSLYLMRVDDQLQRSPVVAGLRIRRGPSASSVISRLEELRGEPKVTAKVESEARTAYRLLALACPPSDGRTQRPVDDLTVPALRARFAGGRNGRGLLLIGGRWHAPAQVLDGPPIFGQYRPFAPQSPQLDPLWHALALARPEARDCLAVLRELAVGSLVETNRSVAMETMNALAGGLDGMSTQLRRQLRTLPLWTGDAWTSGRPIYAVADEAVAASISDQAPVWQPGFKLDGLEALVEALGVTLLTPAQFLPFTSNGYGAADGEELRARFVLTVEHLRMELARCDQPLYKTLEPSWEEFAATRVVLDPELEVAAILGRGLRAVAPARAHLLREPMTLFARSASDVGSSESGGRAIAELFTGDRQKIAWAWVAMWQRAEAGLAADRVVLSTDVESGDEEDRLDKLKTQADTRRTKRQKVRHTGRKDAKNNGTGATGVQVRQLRDLSQLRPTNGGIVNRGAPRGGIVIPGRLRTNRDVGAGANGGGGGNGAGGIGRRAEPQTSTVLPPMSEREQLAYDAVMAALALDEMQVADLRHRRGLGADAIDELAQCFEIKMSSSSEMPNDVTLTPAEVERARTDADFFLAVVAGLEQGSGDLRVRFIFDPLGRLPLRLRGDVTLSGVRDAEALEYVFPLSPVDPAEGLPSSTTCSS